jgi:hypothetical protein
MTQELIANMPGVRREGVTKAAGKLYEEELIQCGHGKVTVPFRPKAEARFCEYYAVVNRERGRALPKITAVQGRRQTRRPEWPAAP